MEQSTNLCWQRRPTTINHCLTSQTILKQRGRERGGETGRGNIAFILYELGLLILLSFAFYGWMQKLGVQVHCPERAELLKFHRDHFPSKTAGARQLLKGGLTAALFPKAQLTAQIGMLQHSATILRNFAKRQK